MKFDKDEKKLKAHRRMKEPCDIVDTTPSWLVGIDGETEKKLRSGRGLKNATERFKWVTMYKILYPQDDEIPSPCKLPSPTSLNLHRTHLTNNPQITKLP
jgi:hypothetical protein